MTSDGDAIARSLAEPEHFAAVFDRHHSAIRGYLRRRVVASVADDLASETFALAFRQRSAFDPARSDARPWLFGIATNLVRRHRRTERRRLRAYARTGSDPLAPPKSHFDAVTGFEPELAAALASLSIRDREVLFLYACADLSYGEISEALGVPVGTVRSRLSRARRQVRELLGPQGAITDDAALIPRRSP